MLALAFDLVFFSLLTPLWQGASTDKNKLVVRIRNAIEIEANYECNVTSK